MRNQRLASSPPSELLGALEAHEHARLRLLQELARRRHLAGLAPSTPGERMTAIFVRGLRYVAQLVRLPAHVLQAYHDDLQWRHLGASRALTRRGVGR